MGYLRSYRGDYGRARMRGDPGLFGFLKKIVGGAVKIGGSILRAGTVPGRLSGLIPGRARPQVQQFPGGRMMTIPTPQVRATGEPMAALAGAGEGRRRRRMNVTNPKALRRAIRRTDGFVKLARRALKGTGYTIVSRSSRVRRTVVKESGPGSVTIQ